MCTAIDTKCFLVTAHQIICLLRLLLTASNIKFNSIRTNCMVGAQVYGVTALQYF